MPLYRCNACGKEKGYKGYCSACYAAWRRMKRRDCSGHCGALAACYSTYCNRCAYLRRRQRNYGPGRLCCRCGEKIRPKYRHEYCQDCASWSNREQILKRQARGLKK